MLIVFSVPNEFALHTDTTNLNLTMQTKKRNNR